MYFRRNLVLILVTYVFLVQNFMLIPKKGVIFLSHFKVIFLPLALEVMTPRSHLFYFNLFHHMSC